MGDAPEEDEGQPRLNQQTNAEDNPIHEPWRQLSGIRSLERLVRSEYGEQERGDGAAICQYTIPECGIHRRRGAVPLELQLLKLVTTWRRGRMRIDLR